MSKEKEITKIKTENQEEEEEENEVFSLQEMIQNNEVASAVLAASDPANCSYNEGYVYRQALYCCITCLKEKLKADGIEEKIDDKTNENYLHAICLGCTYECHSNHELIELYTKRNFKCDCGNSKFNQSNPCKLQPNKDTLNDLNKYNHNFKGKFCTCNRPYPEESEPAEETALNTSQNNISTEENSDEMLQCTICEDWYHVNHLLGSDLFPSKEEDSEDVICHICMENNKYLWYYLGYIAIKIQKETENTVVDIETNTTEPEETNEETCLLKKYKLKFKDLDLEKTNQACFFLAGWRSALCKCTDCLQLYKSKQVEFLLDPNDTIKYYEERGKQNEQTRTSDEDKLLGDHLNKLNRVSQIEFLHSVKDFKDDLANFLTGFAENGQVIKRANVMQFFDELKERKKRRLEDNKSVAGFYCK